MLNTAGREKGREVCPWQREHTATARGSQETTLEFLNRYFLFVQGRIEMQAVSSPGFIFRV